MVAGVFLLEALYLLSVGPLRPRFPDSSDVSTRRIVFFSLGLWTIFFALYSPLDQLSDHYLFSAHMVQHLLLVLVGPPLMLLGTPGWMLRPFLGIPGVFGVAKVLTFPVLAALLFNILIRRLARACDLRGGIEQTFGAHCPAPDLYSYRCDHVVARTKAP